jgi:GTP pyrophosphokinase
MYESDRRIAVEWGRAAKTETGDAFPVRLTVYCDDRYGMLKQMTSIITDEKSNIRNVEAQTSNTQATIDIVLDIDDLSHLRRIITGLRKIPGVHDVQRMQKI